ncbi:SH3 domain-containing protein [Marinobacterium nitratireducens]|uniref:SH3 domain-containing protein n=1 Tax=Marinobacterium nitratireducens TaxID=518897 RepID=UPI001E61DD45|nr:SH3 domain-containing protein [Marinobacterium nitratireducens]
MRILALLAIFACDSLSAADIVEERVQFATGSSGAVIEGKLSGDTIKDYLLRAKSGQQIRIALETSNDANYFNLMQGNDPAAIHIGSNAGNHYEGVLPADGDYRIRVYLMRSAARRDEAANFRLSVSIGDAELAQLQPTADYADGLAGGPDYWAVANVAAGDTLNVRAGAGTANPVVGGLANGDRVRNLGCTMVGTSRWCRIEAGDEQRFSGWVNGHYLVESAPPGADGRQASGVVPCSTAAGQPTGSCAFRVSRGENGTASVWITLPTGGERYLDFREGRPVGTDPGLDLSFERSGDLTLIRIGGVERYEIPDALLFGG